MTRLKKYTFESKVLTLINILFALLFSSCEDVVNVDLETGEPRIVIDAQIIWEKGTDGSEQSIKITKMAPYYSNGAPKVSGAKVSVVNSNGTIFTFNESEAGLYVCTNFVPVINMDYKLHVEVEGQNFTATEKLTSVTPIDRIEQEIVPNIGGGEDLIEVTFYYKDPIDQINYYLTDYKSSFLIYPQYVMTNDELLNGNELNEKFSDQDMKAGNILEITHRGISKNFYNYMNLILEASSGNPFGTVPGNIRGNLVNTTNPDNFALGYFRLCEANHTFYTVK